MSADVDFIAAHREVFGDPTWRAPRDTSPLAFEDGDTLRRSRGGLSRSARREQRSVGSYFPALDAEGVDRDGWAWGAR